MNVNSLDAQTILSDDVFLEVFDMEDEVEATRLLQALEKRATQLSVKTQFKQILAAYRKERKKLQKKVSPDNHNETTFDYWDDGTELNCGNWIANDNGVIELTPFGMNRACYHPILPVQMLRNAETGKEKVKLAYKKGPVWDDIVVDRAMLASAAKIVGLADYGVSVTSENAKYLVRYLSDVENLNMDIIERKVSTSKFGWINGEFLPYNADIEFDSEKQFIDIYESLESRGDYDKWKDCVMKIRKSGRKEPLVYLAGSFASILLKPLNILPFIVNLWSETGKGKTVALMVATSVWANPEEGKYMTDPTDTRVGFEIKSDLLNNLPLVLDDLSKTRDKYGDTFTDLIYMLCSGRGKGRSNRELTLDKVRTWKNIILTNMERPLASETMRGGAINRVLDFEMEEGSVFQNGNSIVETVKNNYGFAGEVFVEIVKKMGFAEVSRIQDKHLHRINEYCKEHKLKKEEKQILPLSVMLAADEIATKFIFQDEIYLDFEWCVNQLKGTDDISENKRAYSAILDEVNIHANNFNPSDDGTFRSEIWGFIRDGYVYIIPSILEQIAIRHNFSTKAFMQWGKRNHLIQYDEERGRERNTKKARMMAGSKTANYYCIRLLEDVEEIEVDGDFYQIGEQENLPF